MLPLLIFEVCLLIRITGWSKLFCNQHTCNRSLMITSLSVRSVKCCCLISQSSCWFQTVKKAVLDDLHEKGSSQGLNSLEQVGLLSFVLFAAPVLGINISYQIIFSLVLSPASHNHGRSYRFGMGRVVGCSPPACISPHMTLHLCKLCRPVSFPFCDGTQ